MSPKLEKFNSPVQNLEDHSAEGIEILSSEPSRLTRIMIYILFSLLLAGIVWSFFGRADVIVRATGLLGAESNERRVYAAIDGELVNVYMAEGMPVSEGDVLARVNAPGAVELATRALSAKMKLEESERQYAILPLQKKVIEQRMELLSVQIEAQELENEKRLSEGMAKLTEEQKLKLEKARAKLEKARNELNYAKLEVEKHERLFQMPGGGGISRNQVEEKRKDYLDKRTAYQLAQAELAEFEIELNKEYLKRKTDIQKEYENLLGLYAQYEEKAYQLANVENQTESELRLARATYEGAARISFDDIDEENFLRIRAPVSGMITMVELNQPGDKVESKKPIAGIAPADARMVLHVEIEESDRGFLREGMPVKMKFNAFPYQRYGFISGTLEYISPATIINPQTKRPVYKGRVHLDRHHFSVENTQIPLRYGMTATVEIVTRQRRLIDLALDPFRRLAG